MAAKKAAARRPSPAPKAPPPPAATVDAAQAAPPGHEQTGEIVQDTSTALIPYDSKTGEVIPRGVGATLDIGPAGQFKVKKLISLPVLSLEGLTTAAVQITSKIYKGKQVQVKRGDRSFTSEAPMINIVDLLDMRPKCMVVNTVLGARLKEEFPKEEFVGRYFILEFSQKIGKAYKNVDITEIERD